MGKKKKQQPVDPNTRSITRNRRARHEYEILDDFEAGIVLQGSEVKSARNNKVSIEEAYARVEVNELWLLSADIAEYPQANLMNHEPRRKRKLLMHKREISKLDAAIQQQGLTIIPLEIYFKEGRIKVQLGLARGRKTHDKREKLKAQTDRKEMRAAKLQR